MGSIYGYWNPTGKEIDQSLFKRAEHLTAWWNPKTIQRHIARNLAFGYQSNKIDDVHRNPLIEPSLVCVGDLRLDNRSKLINRNDSLNKEMADIQIIATLYNIYGIDLLQFLVGAFAFSIYDHQKKLLYVARDHIGVKPMHYCISDDMFGFATQKKSLLCIPTLSKKPDWRYITRRVESLGLHETLTEYRDIKRLPPAHYLQVNSNREVKINEYWQLDVKRKTYYQKNQDYVDHFRELFSQTISDRIADCNSFGSHLSGGLDSSGVTGMAAKVAKDQGKDIHTLSYIIPPKFENHELIIVNENPLIRKQIAYSQIEHSHMIYKPLLLNRRRVIELEAEILDGYSESNNLQTETEIHATMSDHGLQVALSGFPGDELVTSFVRPYYLEYLERNQLFKYFMSKHGTSYQLGKLALPALAKVLSLGSKSTQSQFAKWYGWYTQYFKNKNQFLANHYYNLDLFKNDEYMQLASSQRSQTTYKYGFPITLKEYQRNHISRTHTNRRMESEFISGLKYGVEYRYPLADIRLLEYVLSIPMEQKIDLNGLSRSIFRRSMQSFVIEEIINNDNKKGVVKPMAMFYKKKTAKHLMTLFNYLKLHQRLDYLNLEKVELEIKQNRLPLYFDHYLLLGCLLDQDKMNL